MERPGQPLEGMLIIIDKGAIDQVRLPPGDQALTFGRDETCFRRFDESSVSRHHAQLVVKDGEVFLQDLRSRNGTYVMGKPIFSEVPLRNGDQFQLGPEGPSIELRLKESSAPPKTLIIAVKSTDPRRGVEQLAEKQTGGWQSKARPEGPDTNVPKYGPFGEDPQRGTGQSPTGSPRDWRVPEGDVQHDDRGPEAHLEVIPDGNPGHGGMQPQPSMQPRPEQLGGWAALPPPRTPPQLEPTAKTGTGALAASAATGAPAAEGAGFAATLLAGLDPMLVRQAAALMILLVVACALGLGLAFLGA